MSGDSDRSLIIGARDWMHPGWDEGFYPEDLPAEWRLTYYANEFDSVLVPAERWTTATAGRLAGWEEDVAEQFRFYLELPGVLPEAEALEEQLLLCHQQLSGSLGGLVHWGGLTVPERKRLTGLFGPDHLALPDTGSTPRLKGTALFGGCQERGSEVAGRGSVSLLKGCESYQLRRLKDQIEAIAAQGPGNHALFCQGDPPDVARLRELRLMAEMMGLG